MTNDINNGQNINTNEGEDKTMTNDNIDQNINTTATITTATITTATPTLRPLPTPKEFDPAVLVRRAMSNVTASNVSSIVSSYQSVILNVHSWTAEINSRKAAEDAARVNSADAKLIKAHVSILADNAELKSINNFGQHIRAVNKSMTLPSVDGERLLRNNRMQEHIQVLSEKDREYKAMAHHFAYVTYPTLIAGGQQGLAGLASSVYYPTPDEVYSKFRITIRRQPLSAEANPHADIEANARREMEEMFVQSLKYTVDNAMTESWHTLYSIIHKMAEVLTDKTDEVTGETKKKSLFKSTLIEIPKKYIDTLEQYNVTNDPELEQRAMELRRVLSVMDMEDLKEFPDARRLAVSELTDILSKFDM